MSATEPEFLTQGTFNYVFYYLTADGEERVLKLPKNLDDLTDSPERATRIWNQINASDGDKPACTHELDQHQINWLLKVIKDESDENDVINHQIKVEKGKTYPVWSAPFVRGTHSTPLEIVDGLIDIYTRTGCIVVDAISKNFITTKNKKVVCIDFGMAVDLGSEITESSSTRPRRNSLVSFDIWYHPETQEKYSSYFSDNLKNFKWPIRTIQALLLIQRNRPEIREVSFLLEKPALLKALAKVYCSKKLTEIKQVGKEFDCLVSELVTKDSKVEEAGEQGHSQSPTANNRNRLFYSSDCDGKSSVDVAKTQGEEEDATEETSIKVSSKIAKL